ncbi:putative sucrose-phosphatase 2 [Quercus suber]|uniref:Sucrose-phosphatase n=1 Tax=Quercus suber TaxID=58331 RepID=A0AAW0KVR7_QUESU
MDRLKTLPRLMIVSDLDHTMVDHHDSENLSLLRFNALWESNYRHDSLLVFSTGRSPVLYKKLREEKPMLTPDITIMSVGTEITYGNLMVPDDGWVEILNQKWDRSIVIEESKKFPELTLQAETELRPHKVSFYVEKDKAQAVSKALMERFEKHGTEGKLPNNTLVCGDSGNDAELFSIPEVYGVMVSNAQEELLKWHAENAKNNPKIIHATERCAAGIIQAIGHFGLGPNISPRDVTDFLECKLENVNPGHEVVKFYLFYERWRRAEIENFEPYLASLKASCDPSGVHVEPTGFEHSLWDKIDGMRSIHGDKQGKQFRVWIDQALPTQISSNTWLVKLNKWELSGEERKCCKTTVIVSSKVSYISILTTVIDAAVVSDGLTWRHVHQTWSEEETNLKDHSSSIFIF